MRLQVRWCPSGAPTKDYFYDDWNVPIPNVGDTLYESENPLWWGIVVDRDLFLEERLWLIIVHSPDRPRAQKLKE